MDNTTYIALSRQQSLWNQLEVVANNLANVNTSGFKGSDTLFSQYVYKVKSEDRTFRDRVAFTHDFGLVRNLAQGTLNFTGNTFDLAMQSDGYFVVQQPGSADGRTPPEERYTRAGSFTVNGDGTLVSQAGLPVMSVDGQSIQIPADAGEITVQGDGSIKAADGRTIGKLRVVNFQDERQLKALDGTQFTTRPGQQPLEVAAPKVAQGVLEDSNVNAISEMTRLINVNRAYTDVSKLIDAEHKRKQQAAETFTRQVSA
jgi:flagellar basal-body rod protein FlgF